MEYDNRMVSIYHRWYLSSMIDGYHAIIMEWCHYHAMILGIARRESWMNYHCIMDGYVKVINRGNPDSFGFIEKRAFC